MLNLNQEVSVIVDEKGRVEYDYDGPMLDSSDDIDYLRDCLVYLQDVNKKKKYRIAKVKLVEI